MLGTYPDELRADLQQTYGIDLDRAMEGEHGAAHVAACAACLPPGSRVLEAMDADTAWTMDRLLLVSIYNAVNLLSWSLCAERGTRRPQLAGPSWLRELSDGANKLKTMVMPVDELEAKLAEFDAMARDGK